MGTGRIRSGTGPPITVRPSPFAIGHLPSVDDCSSPPELERQLNHAGRLAGSPRLGYRDMVGTAALDAPGAWRHRETLIETQSRNQRLSVSAGLCSIPDVPQTPAFKLAA